MSKKQMAAKIAELEARIEKLSGSHALPAPIPPREWYADTIPPAVPAWTKRSVYVDGAQATGAPGWHHIAVGD